MRPHVWGHMTIAFRRLATVLLLVLWAVPALAQTADEIIEKHLAATGGRAALSKLTSRVSTGAISLTTPVGELAGTVEVYAKAPNKQRTLIKLDLTALGAGQVVNDQRFDGNAGYLMDSINGNREIAGPQLDAMRNSAFPTALLDYKARGIEASLLPDESVGGKPAYVIKMTPKAGPVAKVFIDRDSYMLVRTSATINVPQLGGDIEQVTEFSDFRDVDGLKLPFATRSINPAQTVSATLSSVKHNVDIDDASFTRPQ